MSSYYCDIEQGPAIEVFALNKLCLEDSFAEKVNLGVGGKFLSTFFTNVNFSYFITMSIVRSYLLLRFKLFYLSYYLF